MWKEIGQKCVRNTFLFLVLAFFTVVASSPNLSTFVFSGAKIQQKSEK